MEPIHSKNSVDWEKYQKMRNEVTIKVRYEKVKYLKMLLMAIKVNLRKCGGILKKYHLEKPSSTTQQNYCF